MVHCKDIDNTEDKQLRANPFQQQQQQQRRLDLHWRGPKAVPMLILRISLYCMSTATTGTRPRPVWCLHPWLVLTYRSSSPGMYFGPARQSNDGPSGGGLRLSLTLRRSTWYLRWLPGGHRTAVARSCVFTTEYRILSVSRQWTALCYDIYCHRTTDRISLESYCLDTTRYASRQHAKRCIFIVVFFEENYFLISGRDSRFFPVFINPLPTRPTYLWLVDSNFDGKRLKKIISKLTDEVMGVNTCVPLWRFMVLGKEYILNY